MNKVIYTILFLGISWLNAMDFQLKGQATVYGLLSNHPFSSNQSGIQYIPTLTLNNFKKSLPVDLEIALFSNAEFIKSDTIALSIETYRYNLRYTSDWGECRLGLQKINFGPAQLLRSLQWFDTIKPLDPTHISDGVEAALLRYYFPNDANIWLWAQLSDERGAPYPLAVDLSTGTGLGGRFQYPLGRTEMGLTFHSVENTFTEKTFRETRFAFDLRSEYIAGLWLEAMGLYNDKDLPGIPQWHQSYTLGIDYTFGIGNGLYSILETKYSKNSNIPAGESKTLALMMTYPLGILDNIQGFYAYDQSYDRQSWYLAWQRVYDSVIFNVNMTVMKDSEDNYTKSVQCMIIYNH